MTLVGSSDQVADRLEESALQVHGTKPVARKHTLSYVELTH